MKNAVLRGCNVLVSASERNRGRPVVKLNYFKEDASSELNGFFENMGVREMLHGKEFEALDMVFRLWKHLLIVASDSFSML